MKASGSFKETNKGVQENAQCHAAVVPQCHSYIPTKTPKRTNYFITIYKFTKRFHAQALQRHLYCKSDTASSH